MFYSTYSNKHLLLIYKKTNVIQIYILRKK